MAKKSAKKAQRRLVQYEKDKSGCMWGFISMFDFRHGHSTRKMIADKRRSSKHAVGAVHSNSINKLEMLSNLDEVREGSFDGGESRRPTVSTVVNKPSVKKLIEEEMFIDQNAMKNRDNAEIETKDSRLRREVLVKLDSKRKKKSSNKSLDMDTNDLNLDIPFKSEITHNQHSRRQSKDTFDLDKMIEEFCHLKDACSMMHGNDGEEVQAQSNQKKQAISENNIRDAIREFVNQMILNGKDLAEARKLLCSHQLMEALQLISSDRELFLSLLQNPNSLLFKCVEEFGNSQETKDKEHCCVTGSNFTDHDDNIVEQNTEIVNHKKHNFFRKKAKSQSKSSTKENGSTDMSSRIVILKPGGQMNLQNSETGNSLASSQDSHETVKYNGPSARGSSHFSLTEIKKKLKHAMGRERHGSPEGISKRHSPEFQNKVPSSKAINKDNVGMRSPNKDHFFIEKIARPPPGALKGDKSGAIKDSELLVEHENSTFPKQRVSSLYIEAKKHLCEMVGNGDEKVDMSGRQISKTLGRILSLPEYNFSPLASPGRDWEHHFVTAQTRFSTSDKNWENNKDSLSPKKGTFSSDLDQKTDNSEKLLSIYDESSKDQVQEIKSDTNVADDLHLGHVGEAGNCCLVRDEIVTEGDVKSVKVLNASESSSEPVGKEDENNDIPEISDGARCSQCLKQDVTEENKPSSPLTSPSHSSTTKKTEEPESVTDVSSRPSPVSVLDTPFIEEDVSSNYSRFQPVEVTIQPVHMRFEEQDSSPLNQTNRGKHCLGENELIYDYIKAVLQASGLTTDQLLVKCLSSDKILDPSLFDHVEFLSNQLCHDEKLLYDCINEVLIEVCWNHFVVSPCVSFMSSGIRATPNLKRVILKVWEGVCWHFLSFPPPRTLDKIVKKDMGKNGAWMDLRIEAETIGFEMGEAILAELMEDTILSCVSMSPESESSQLQLEHKDNENSTNE
ncbi:hypothetical protein RJT34_15530 [Clitoria ternatea]|uniref:DUF4378 domain-containing protein n=1 Tax=Clitoria ternatea TaxID=43366 RepID=A0AAN9J6K1_CLITE